MAVVIRLARFGTKKTPHYRIVVADSRMPRDGRFLEQIGSYDPNKESEREKVDAERALYWLGRGAQPSATVKDIFKRAGVLKPQPKTPA